MFRQSTKHALRQMFTFVYDTVAIQLCLEDDLEISNNIINETVKTDPLTTEHDEIGILNEYTSAKLQFTRYASWASASYGDTITSTRGIERHAYNHTIQPASQHKRTRTILCTISLVIVADCRSHHFAVAMRFTRRASFVFCFAGSWRPQKREWHDNRSPTVRVRTWEQIAQFWKSRVIMIKAKNLILDKYTTQIPVDYDSHTLHFHMLPCTWRCARQWQLFAQRIRLCFP